MAESASIVARSHEIRVELAAAVELCKLGSARVGEQTRQQALAYAEQMIDIHGRWARHVALAAAARGALGDNHRSAAFWQAVFAAIIDLQVGSG